MDYRELHVLDTLPKDYKIFYDIDFPNPNPDAPNGHNSLDAIVVGPSGVSVIFYRRWRGSLTMPENSDKWLLNGTQPKTDPMKFCSVIEGIVCKTLKDKTGEFAPVTAYMYMPYIEFMENQYITTLLTEDSLIESVKGWDTSVLSKTAVQKCAAYIQEFTTAKTPSKSKSKISKATNKPKNKTAKKSQVQRTAKKSTTPSKNVVPTQGSADRYSIGVKDNGEKSPTSPSTADGLSTFIIAGSLVVIFLLVIITVLQ